MKSDNTEKKRLAFRTSDKILLGVLAVLIVAIAVVSILSRAGLALINGVVTMYLPLLALFVLVGWGGYALIRRIRKPIVKTIVASVSVLAMLVLVVLVVSYASYFAYYTVPQKYATVRSPSGARKLAVMRSFDIDSERSDQRKAARLEANPESSPDLTPQDIVMLYKAYPEVLGLFYRTNADVEGEVCLAYALPEAATGGEEATTEESAEDKGEEASSEEPNEGEEASPAKSSGGTLMIEWLDGEATAHFYVDNPGVAEGGECFVRFEKAGDE